jgi:hypothetical protein
MARTKRISRRHFLYATTAVVLSAAITRTSSQDIAASSEPQAGYRLASLRGRKGAIVIGKRYLSLFPQQSEAATLQALLKADLTVHRGDLAALIRSDFRTGRTLHADGWALSLTEARLCALANLPNAA